MPKPGREPGFRVPGVWAMAASEDALTLSAAVVRPGDTLVVVRPGKLTNAEADAVKARLWERLPGVEIVLLCGEFTQVLAYKPDGQE